MPKMNCWPLFCHTFFLFRSVWRSGIVSFSCITLRVYETTLLLGGGAVLYISFFNRFQISTTKLCTDWSIKIKASITSHALYAYVHAQLLSQIWLCNPMGYSPPGSSVHGISQARILEWVVISFSRGFS